MLTELRDKGILKGEIEDMMKVRLNLIEKI